MGFHFSILFRFCIHFTISSLGFWIWCRTLSFKIIAPVFFFFFSFNIIVFPNCFSLTKHQKQNYDILVVNYELSLKWVLDLYPVWWLLLLNLAHEVCNYSRGPCIKWHTSDHLREWFSWQTWWHPWVMPWGTYIAYIHLVWNNFLSVILDPCCYG